MKTKSISFAPIARRARTIAVGLAAAGAVAGFAACGDDETDQANEAIENLESALDEVDTEALQQQAEEAQQQIESAVDEIDTEALQQQAEEAQKQLEDAYGGGN